MRIIDLPIENRTEKPNICRNEGFVPGVAYRKGENLKVKSRLNDFVRVCKSATTAQVFRLVSSDAALNSRLGIIKDIQIEYLKKAPLHFDIQLVNEDERVEVEVPIKFVGESVGVKNSGGVLSIIKHSILLSCLPMSVPEHVIVDLTKLDVGDSIHIRDISLPEGVEHAEDLDDPVVSVVKQEQEGEQEQETQPIGEQSPKK